MNAIVDHQKLTIDTLLNLLSGLGTQADKTMHARFVLPVAVLDQAALENAYRGDWIARNVVNIPAKDATREWRMWQADTSDVGAIEDLEKKFQVQAKTRSAMIKGRLYGGGALIIGVNDGDQSKPLDPTKVGKDGLLFLHAVSKNDLNAGPLVDDVLSPDYNTPEYYTSRTSQSKQERIHPSRVVRFLGNEFPDVNMVSVAGTSVGWSDSVLAPVYDAAVAAGLVSGSGASLVQEMTYDIIKVPGLTQNITTKEYEQRLTRRFSYSNSAKSIIRSLILDKEEEWERVSTNLSGLPDIIKVYLLIASAAAEIPATRMLGQSPQGLNATGESDLRNHYDNVRAEQNNTLKPALDILDQVLVRSALGDYPEDLYYEWNPLWQLDDVQSAQRDYQHAQTFQIDVNSGLINEDALRQARINQLVEDGTYPGLEDAIDEFGDAPPEPVGQFDPVTGLPTDPVLQAAQKLNAAQPPAPGNKPPPAANNNFAKQRAAADRMLNADARARFRKRKKGRYAIGSVGDAEPRTLFLRRDVTNAADILAHYEAQGVTGLIPASEMHVTIAYSRTPVDWMRLGSDGWGQNPDGTMSVPPGGIRLNEALGDSRVSTLMFVNNNLAWRHAEICRAGASWDYDEYQPHLTFAVQMSKDELRALEPWQGPIELGPEIASEIEPGYTYAA